MSDLELGLGVSRGRLPVRDAGAGDPEEAASIGLTAEASLNEFRGAPRSADGNLTR
jgi:hypothetical protein